MKAKVKPTTKLLSPVLQASTICGTLWGTFS